MVLVRRFPRHCVRVDPGYFTIEHPPTCDLDVCDIFPRAVESWAEAPGPVGWHTLTDDLQLEPLEERKLYNVTEVEDE